MNLTALATVFWTCLSVLGLYLLLRLLAGCIAAIRLEDEVEFAASLTVLTALLVAIATACMYLGAVSR